MECITAMPNISDSLLNMLSWMTFWKYHDIGSSIKCTDIFMRMCMQATRFASLFTPILEISAVTQVPMLQPMMIGRDIPHVRPPVFENACKIPIEPAELWIIPVNPAPTRTPRIGFLKCCEYSLEFQVNLPEGSTESDIRVIPVISMAKPTRIRPMSFFLFFFATIISITPMQEQQAVRMMTGLSIFMKRIPFRQHRRD